MTGLLLASAALPSLGVCAEDAVIADPKHYTLEFENDRVRVIRATYGPHEKSVMHTHGPNVAVFLSNGKVRFTLPDGSAVEATQEVGSIEWADAEEHLPENLTDQPLEVLLVELKD
jgi:quercetin dioxygenase-like cupin family protein